MYCESEEINGNETETFIMRLRANKMKIIEKYCKFLQIK